MLNIVTNFHFLQAHMQNHNYKQNNNDDCPYKDLIDRNLLKLIIFIIEIAHKHTNKEWVRNQSPQMYLQRALQSSMVAQALILFSNATTETFLLSRILQVSKKALILLMVCEGTSVMSLQDEQTGSFSTTPITLSSTSPVSIILITPKTRTFTKVRGGIFTLAMTIMSKGSLSRPIVLGMKPQLMGKTTGVARTRSSMSSPDSQSSSNFQLDPSGIYMTALILTGSLTLSSTPWRGCLTQRGFSI